MLYEGGCVSVYFVDDNFIGNPKAADALLDALIKPGSSGPIAITICGWPARRR